MYSRIWPTARPGVFRFWEDVWRIRRRLLFSVFANESDMAARSQSVRRTAVPKSTARRGAVPGSSAAESKARKSSAAKSPASARGRKPSAAQAPSRTALAQSAAAKPKASPKPAPAPAPVPAAPRGKAAPQPKKVAPRVSLGRPTVVGEELLDLVFKEDFHARQIFVFLGVRTVRELEEFGPQQILDKAAQPLKESIDRIRRRLAILNRALRDDEEFAVKFLERVAAEGSL